MQRSPGSWPGVALVALTLMAGCVAEAPTPEGPPPTAEPAAPAAAPVAAPDVFVDVVWRVAESPQVQQGQLYVFLSTGALVIASANGTPMIGSWTAENGRLATMTEEGVTYPIEVLALDANQFRIRSLNPGQPVEITLERAALSR